MILTPVPQADGKTKHRPAVILREMPPFRDWLMCGVSSQLQHHVQDFDEIISPGDSDFAASGLLNRSVIRLGFLAVVPRRSVPGGIGSISSERHQRLLKKLGAHLLASTTISPPQ